MAKVSYVYPNVSGITQRGGLWERLKLARNVGCDFIEVPADFIKNKTESEKTSLKFGDFLTEEAIHVLYSKDEKLSPNIKYILHTEPSLPRSDGYGLSCQAPIKWYDDKWVETFVEMLISLSKYFTIPPTAIEIHPGDKRNSFVALSTSIRFLLEEYKKKFGVQPLILLENRTGQFISTGQNILKFWTCLLERDYLLEEKVGIVLDAQQLYTVTKAEFLKELEKIPSESLKGFHIHYRHRVPNLSHEIPWKQIFNEIANLKNDIIINPEIHHKNRVKDAILFCEEMLQR